MNKSVKPLSVEGGMSDDVELELSQAVRLELFMSHECHGTYGDDGEMQCNVNPRIDFKRDFPSEILAKAWLHRLIRAAAVPVAIPAVPVEERTATPLFNDPAHMIGAILDRIDMAPNDDPIPYIREYVDGLRERNCLAERPMLAPIPEERTAEMEELMGNVFCRQEKPSKPL